MSVQFYSTAFDQELTIHERQRVRQDIIAIMAWVNTYLKQRSCPARAIETDFRDGVRVIVLLETAFNERISSYNSRPKLPYHCLDNLAIAFQFCSNHGVSLINIDPHSIMNGFVKPTLNMFRSLLRALTIRGLKDFTNSESLCQSISSFDHSIAGSSFRNQLLRWVSDTFAGIVPDVQIDNFWSSFKDGVVFCGLIESLVPGSIDLNEIHDQDSSEKLALAFRVSEKRLGIPAILSPEDFRSNSKPDEAAVEFYISMLVSAAAGTRKRDHSALEEVNAIKLKNEKEMGLITERMMESERRMQEMIEANEMAASKEKMLQDQLLSDGIALAQYKAKYDQLLEQNQKNHALLQELPASEGNLPERVVELEAALDQRDTSIAQLQAENARLKAEVYATQIEAMDIQKRFQSKEKRPELDKVVEQQFEISSFKTSRVDLKAAAAGLIGSSRQGWLMIRKIGGGFFVKPKLKKRFFELRGDCLLHSDKKPITISSCKIIKLSQYQKLEIESDVLDLYEDFKQLMNEKICDKTGAPYGENADVQVVLRLIPKPHKTGLNSYELSPVQSFNVEIREDVHVWRQEINDQIALQGYLKDVDDGVAGVCKEVVEFVTNPSQTTLSITDHSKDLHRVLTHFKESLILRKNLLLNIDNVALSLSSLQIIGEIVARNQSIRVVNLPNNQITSKTVRPLTDALKVNRSVQEINLVNNILKDEGVMMLSDALAYHPRLRRLRLSGNGITCIGASSLCNAIRASSDRFRWEHLFPSLDLSHNSIGDRGAESIANLIRCNTTITRLCLSRNQISDVGLAAISLALRLYPRPIEDIQLAQNQLTSRGIINLAEALQDLSTVHKIDLSRNQMVGRSGIIRLLHADVPIKFEAFVIVRGHFAGERRKDSRIAREDQ